MAVVIALAGTADIAALSAIEAVISEADILAFTGQSDTDPRCLELLSDGRLVFFDTEPGVDAVILFDPALAGVARFTTVASEAQILALAPNTTVPTNVTVSSITVDSNGDLYILASETTEGPDYDNCVVAIPASGAAFASPTLAVDVFDGGKSGSGDFTYLRVEADPSGNRLFILFDNLTTSNDTPAVAGVNGVYTFDLALAPGATGDLQLLSAYTALAAAVTPAATPGSDSVGLVQIQADPTGTWLYGINSLGTGSADGDLVRIATSDGSVSLFLDTATSEPQTDVTDLFSFLSALALHPVSGNLVVIETGGSDSRREQVYEYAPDGTFLGIIHSHDEITGAVLAVGSDFAMGFTNSLDVNASGEVYLWMSQSTETLVRAPSTLTHPLTGAPGLIWPICVDTSPKLTSSFGPRQLSHPNGRYDWHRGLDIPLPTGTRVYAVNDGTLRFSGVTAGFSDPVVQVQHGSGGSALYSTNLHVSAWFGTIGNPVTQGDLIGLSGKSVASGTGFQHLHFEVRDGGTSQLFNRHPLGHLPLNDTPPIPPALTGANLDPSGAVLLLDVTTPRTEIDTDGISVSWGTDNVQFSIDIANGANPGAASDMDHPPLGLGSRVRVGVTPARTVDDYLRQFAVWGLDSVGVSGSATHNDFTQSSTPTALNPDLPSATLTPAVQSQNVASGDTGVFNHTLTNTSGGSLTVSISSLSAQRNTVTLSDTGLTLGPGASQMITVTVDHDSSFPSGIGDMIVLQISSGTAQTLAAIDLIGDPLELPLSVPVGLSLLGAN